MKCQVLILAAFLSGNAVAMMTECGLTGRVTAFPTHPTPRDAVAYQVSLHPARLTGVPHLAYANVSVEPHFPLGKITINVVVSAEPLALTGFTVTPLRFSQVLGPFGQIPAGTYEVWSNVSAWDHDTGLYSITDRCSASQPLTLVVSEPGDPVRKAAVVEFYNATLDHYFITQNQGEIDHLDAGNDWRRTGQSFLAYTPDAADGRGQPVARYYGLPSAGLDSHFYSWNWWEVWGLGNSAAENYPSTNGGWLFETAAAFAIDWPSTEGICGSGTVPVYRLWNGRADSSHRYTTDPAIKQQMVAKGYVPEGYGPNAVFMCAIAP